MTGVVKVRVAKIMSGMDTSAILPEFGRGKPADSQPSELTPGVGEAMANIESPMPKMT
ncbi:MAG: hypothetical protein ACREBS_07520 [Nitrososphaerales archaeon]